MLRHVRNLYSPANTRCWASVADDLEQHFILARLYIIEMYTIHNVSENSKLQGQTLQMIV